MMECLSTELPLKAPDDLRAPRGASNTRATCHNLRFPAYTNANSELGRYPVGIVRTREQNRVCLSLFCCVRG